MRMWSEQSDVFNVIVIPFDQKYVFRCFDSLVRFKKTLIRGSYDFFSLNENCGTTLMSHQLLSSTFLIIKISHILPFNPLNPELNPICYLLALLGAHHLLHVSRIRVKLLTLRRLMSYIYIWSTHS